VKINLEFNLPEETNECKRAVQGLNLCSVLTEVDNQLRDWLKHGHNFATATEALEATRNYLTQALVDRDINIHE
jgi:hypothetical protein